MHCGLWEPGGEWKGATVNTAIEGKALLFKEIGRNEHIVHSEFKRLPDSVSVADAVGLLTAGEVPVSSTRQ
jgi:hypothetical protein